MQVPPIPGSGLLVVVVGVFAGLRWGVWIGTYTWLAACVFAYCVVWCGVCGPLCGGLGVCVCVDVACVFPLHQRLCVREFGGPRPILAEGPGCSSRQIVAGICCSCWLVVPRISLLRVLGAAPCHFFKTSQNFSVRNSTKCTIHTALVCTIVLE